MLFGAVKRVNLNALFSFRHGFPLAKRHVTVRCDRCFKVKLLKRFEFESILFFKSDYFQVESKNALRRTQFYSVTMRYARLE